MPPTRRDFLKSSAAAIAGAMLSSAAIADADQTSQPAPIRTTVTDAEGRRLAAGKSLAWSGAAQTAGDVVLDPSKTAQTIHGFGAALTDAACFNLNRLDPDARRELFAELFSPRLGFSVCRLCVGSSDYSTKVYSYDDGGPDPQIERFSIAHDLQYILPILREARGVNPDLYLFGSPWSPPGWMKYGNSMLGGSIKPKNLDSYSLYILKYLQAYKKAGVTVDAVTTQNELDADQDGRMPACTWAQEVEGWYISDHLGPLLEKHDIKTEIWQLDHNYDLWGRVLDQLGKPGVKKYCDAVAWHGYAGTPDMMMNVKNAYPDIDMHWTEGGDELTDGAYTSDWSKWGATFAGILHNGPRSIVSWNLALDENGKPNVGPFHCAGMITIDSQSSKITRNGIYWAMAHYARAFRRGARVIQSTSTSNVASHIAVTNTDGTAALILTNPNDALTVSVRAGDNITLVDLPRDSITTLEWNAS